jgi:hypothetical protein
MSTTKKLLASGAAMLVAGASLLTSIACAHADPVWHQVVYIVSARNPAYVDIFYQDQDPTLFSDYSHNNYIFTPQVHADIAPGKPWFNPEPVRPRSVGEVPSLPAMNRGHPAFNDLSVDRKVVVSRSVPRARSVRWTGEPPSRRYPRTGLGLAFEAAQVASTSSGFGVTARHANCLLSTRNRDKLVMSTAHTTGVMGSTP